MGSIRVRQGRYQANVRRKGYATVTKTFTSREVAKRWIKSTEIAIERGDYAPRCTITVGELMHKYENEYLPTLKNGGDSHKWRVRLLKRYFNDLPLADLTPAHLAKYRDQRLLKVAPLTVKRDLSVLSSAINTAARFKSCLKDQIQKCRCATRQAIATWGRRITSEQGIPMSKPPNYRGNRNSNASGRDL